MFRCFVARYLLHYYSLVSFLYFLELFCVLYTVHSKTLKVQFNYITREVPASEPGATTSTPHSLIHFLVLRAGSWEAVTQPNRILTPLQREERTTACSQNACKCLTEKPPRRRFTILCVRLMIILSSREMNSHWPST